MRNPEDNSSNNYSKGGSGSYEHLNVSFIYAEITLMLVRLLRTCNNISLSSHIINTICTMEVEVGMHL